LPGTRKEEQEDSIMTYQKMLGQYKKLNVETAGKLELVIMCYEKAIELLRQARKYYEEGQMEGKAAKLQRALDIIQELQASLNPEKGGQIAKNLAALYSYLTRRLLDGDLRRDLTAVEETIRILSELKDAWQKIASEHVSQTEPGKRAPQPRKGLEQLAA
jgi:flagellar secretion chaperone FliS